MQRVDKAPPAIHRALEVCTGGLTVLVASAPLWAALLVPRLWLVAFTLFSLYWLYAACSLAGGGVLGYLRMRRWQRRDWLADLRRQTAWERWHHLVVFPICGEPIGLLQESLDALVAQTFPAGRVTVLLAFEAADAEAPRKLALLRAGYGPHFRAVLAASHMLSLGAVKGKASNLAYAVPLAQQALAERGISTRQTLLTVCDADSRLDRNYLAALLSTYLDSPRGERHIYQPAMLFYANRGRLPVWARVINGFYSVLQVGRLPATHKLVAQSTYSLRLAEAQRIGYWDADVVPEDSHMFFKFYFGHRGEATPRPIYLPVWSDAAEGQTWWDTLASHYRQARRWAWGVSDVPYVAWQVVKSRRPALLARPFHFAWAHLLWPAHWFLLMGGLRVVQGAHPRIFALPWSQSLEELSATALTLTLPCLVVLIVLDYLLRAQRQTSAGVDLLALPLWFALPLLGLLSVLPGLEAHLRLLVGRPLAYEVTEKHSSAPAPARIPQGAFSD